MEIDIYQSLTARTRVHWNRHLPVFNSET